MRITYLHQYFNTPAMSGGTRSYEMARRLVEMGHEVNIVTSWREADGSKHWFTTEEAGVRVHWLPLPYSNYMTYRQRMVTFLKFAWLAGRRAASLSSDIVFATSTPLTIALPGIYASWRQKVPMVFEVRDLWPEVPISIGALSNPATRYAARILERFAYQSSAEVVALSEGMAAGIVSTGFPSSRVTVITNGANLELFYPNDEGRVKFRARYGVREEQLLIVYAGTFGRINGVRYIPELAAELADDARFKFIMVGDGIDFSVVHAVAKKLGVLNNNLVILESMPKDQMPEVLAAADIATSIFIPLRSMEANSANKFFDGLAAGCCMAINYGGWQARLLNETGAGLQLDNYVAVAARQLQELADQPIRLTRAKGSARKLAEEQFSFDKLAMRLEQVLYRAVSS